MRSLIKLEKENVMQTYSRIQVEFSHGSGCYLFDNKGKKYLDMVSGIATCPIGHGNKEFAKIVKRQILRLTNVSNLYYSRPQLLLAKKLSKLSGLDKCFFSNSGTESIEAAIKLAKKHTGKNKIIAMKSGFHGRTYGSLSATDKTSIKKDFGELLPGFVHVSYNDVIAISKAIDKGTAAVLIEPIQGESGVIVPSFGFLKKVRKLCTQKKVLLILDEIQTGLGRTGKFFAFDHENIKPDIVTLAKGLANGIPIGVTIASKKVAKSFVPGDHGSTFGGNAVSSTAALFTLNPMIGQRQALFRIHMA